MSRQSKSPRAWPSDARGLWVSRRYVLWAGRRDKLSLVLHWVTMMDLWLAHLNITTMISCMKYQGGCTISVQRSLSFFQYRSLWLMVEKQIGVFMPHVHVQSSAQQDNEFMLMGEITEVSECQFIAACRKFIEHRWIWWCLHAKWYRQMTGDPAPRWPVSFLGWTEWRNNLRSALYKRCSKVMCWCISMSWLAWIVVHAHGTETKTYLTLVTLFLLWAVSFSSRMMLHLCMWTTLGLSYNSDGENKQFRNVSCIFNIRESQLLVHLGFVCAFRRTCKKEVIKIWSRHQLHPAIIRLRFLWREC